MDTRDERVVDSPMATDAGSVAMIMETGGHAARAPHALGLAKAEIARYLGYDVKSIRTHLPFSWRRK